MAGYSVLSTCVLTLIILVCLGSWSCLFSESRWLPLAVAVFLNVLTAQAFLYVRNSDPGIVTSAVVRWVEANRENMLETKQDGSARWCGWCEDWKPDRCHHCHDCGTCWLRMDHHCVFVNNCIGARNRKAFMLLLARVVVSCAWGGWCTNWNMFHTTLNRLIRGKCGVWCGVIVAVPLLQVVFGIAIALFGTFHLLLIMFNTTTVEFMEKRHHLVHGERYINPWNVGVWRNLQLSLGRNPLYWFTITDPIAGVPLDKPGGGVIYFHNDQHHHYPAAMGEHKEKFDPHANSTVRSVLDERPLPPPPSTNGARKRKEKVVNLD